MSNPGERDDAPELDLEEASHVEEQGTDESGSDEGDADDLGEEPGDGDVDPEQGDDAGEDEGQAGKSAEVTGKPRSAATIAVQEAKRAAKEAKAEAEVLRRERDEALRERQGRQTEESRRLEQERIALMAPEEKTEYLLNRQQQGFDARFAALEYRQWDSADRTAFDGLCARNPAYDSVRDDVERQAETMRRAGQQVPERKVLAAYFIGQRAIERATKGGKAKQAAKGRENVQRQQAKPVGGRSDVAGGRERSGGGNEAAARARR
jgi:hypothetical protein